jgi:hypothetical protein
MAKYLYALEPGQPKRLEIDLRLRDYSAKVRLDGNEIFSIADQRTFTKGVEIPLPDGSKISAQLKSGFLGTDVLVSRNGQALPGSTEDPASRLKTVSQILYFLAALNILGGALTFFTTSTLMSDLGLSWYSIIYGVVFLVIAFLTQRKSKPALIIGIILLAVDWFIGALLSATQGAMAPITGLFMRLFFIAMVFPGIKAIDELKNTTDPTISNNK